MRKNMSKINQNRKKHGAGQIVLNAEKKDKFVGRNFVLPILLIVFVSFYIIMFSVGTDSKFSGMEWLTIACYFLLASLFFFRRPYLTIGKDYVQTRRMMGDRRLYVKDIKTIRVQNGYVSILPQKGAGWMFSRMLNRFKTDEMTEKLKSFAATHSIPFEQL